MQGTEYLLPSDTVIVFFSAAAPVMEQRRLKEIQNSGCGFETYKLLKQRKNGLDFYIATKVGELFGAKQCTRAVLISRDTGFQAIRDYWQECSGTKNRVYLSESIECGIVSSGEAGPRTDQIREGRKGVDIGNFYAAYQEGQKLQQALREMFSGTSFLDRLPDLEQIAKGGSPKVIYLDSLRRFGREEGREVYRILKANGEKF